MKSPTDQPSGSHLKTLHHHALGSTLWSIAAGVVLTLATHCHSLAASIGLNFVGRGDPTSLNDTDVAGVVPQKEWNNIGSEPPFKATAAGLTDSDGQFTAVTFSFEANDSWNSNGQSTTPNEKLMYGIMKRQGVGTTAIYTLDNVPDGSYDVIVYTATDGDGAWIDTTIGDSTFYTVCTHEFRGEFILAKNTANDNALRDVGNYVRFTGVRPLGGQIEIRATYQGNGGNGLGTPGIQLIGSGSYPPNTLPLGSVTDPKNVTVEVGPSGTGPSATFSVSADLPADYQWFKNGVAIPGATGSSYTTPPTTLADDGAAFYCVANNNVNSLTSGQAFISVTPTRNWLKNGRLSLAAAQNQLNASPVAWTIVSTNLLTGPNVDGASSAGFANDNTSDPDSPNGLWFKPFSGRTNDDFFGGNLIDVHFFQDTPGIPGEVYELTGHARAENNYCDLIEGSPTKSLFALEFLNASGAILASEVIDLQDLIASKNWIVSTVTATAPAGTTTVRSRASMINGFFSKDPAQSYFVDNFELVCTIPTIRESVLTATGLTLSGTCGTPGGTYNVLASDDLTKPVSTWTKLQSGTFEGTGNFSFTISPTDGPKRFFVIEAP